MLLLLRCVLRLKFFFLLQIVLCIELLKLADGAGISSQLWSCVQEEKCLVLHVSDFDFNSSQLSLAFLREDFHYVLALYPSHPDPAAEVFSIHHPEGFQSSLGISLLHFFSGFQHSSASPVFLAATCSSLLPKPTSSVPPDLQWFIGTLFIFVLQ